MHPYSVPWLWYSPSSGNTLDKGNLSCLDNYFNSAVTGGMVLFIWDSPHQVPWPNFVRNSLFICAHPLPPLPDVLLTAIDHSCTWRMGSLKINQLSSLQGRAPRNSSKQIPAQAKSALLKSGTVDLPCSFLSGSWTPPSRGHCSRDCADLHTPTTASLSVSRRPSRRLPL